MRRKKKMKKMVRLRKKRLISDGNNEFVCGAKGRLTL